MAKINKIFENDIVAENRLYKKPSIKDKLEIAKKDIKNNYKPTPSKTLHINEQSI